MRLCGAAQAVTVWQCLWGGGGVERGSCVWWRWEEQEQLDRFGGGGICGWEEASSQHIVQTCFTAAPPRPHASPPAPSANPPHCQPTMRNAQPFWWSRMPPEAPAEEAASSAAAQAAAGGPVVPSVPPSVASLGRVNAWVSVELEGIAKPQPRYEHAAALFSEGDQLMIILGGHYSAWRQPRAGTANARGHPPACVLAVCGLQAANCGPACKPAQPSCGIAIPASVVS